MHSCYSPARCLTPHQRSLSPAALPSCSSTAARRLNASTSAVALSLALLPTLRACRACACSNVRRCSGRDHSMLRSAAPTARTLRPAPPNALGSPPLQHPPPCPVSACLCPAPGAGAPPSPQCLPGWPGRPRSPASGTGTPPLRTPAPARPPPSALPPRTAPAPPRAAPPCTAGTPRRRWRLRRPRAAHPGKRGSRAGRLPRT